MKKCLAITGVLALAVSLLGCKPVPQDTEPQIVRSFLAGYEEEHRSSRVLLNLLEDGTAAFYVGQLEQDRHTTAQYTGTYVLGENDAFDETITITHQQDSATPSVILDGVFEMALDLGPVRFYETAPVSMDGDVYVGYLAKSSGMGPMVYGYGLTLGTDGTFDVSIMQMASVMHVWGSTGGTYAQDGNIITFTYDILTDQGELVSPDETTEATDFNGLRLSTGFNIQQNTMRASQALFIQVNEKEK